MILAGIDIGTNALRLLIAEFRRDAGRIEIRRIQDARIITRLGEGLVDRGQLSDPAILRTFRALHEFRSILSQHPVHAVIAVATSAVREAGNQRIFLDRLKSEIGFEPEVISGEEEARRTLKGVRYGLGPEDRDILVMDIGGGSTEWMLVTGGDIERIESVETGVVKLTDRYLNSDPLSRADEARLLRGIEDAIGPVLNSIGNRPGHRLIGTAGTATTLAALELKLERYAASRVHKMSLSRERIESWYRELIGMSVDQRRGLAGLEPGREDLIVAGTALLMTAMRKLGFPEVVVSDYGLKEGILIDWAERNMAA